MCVFLVALWGRIEFKLEFLFLVLLYFLCIHFMPFAKLRLSVGDDAKRIMNQEESIFDDDDDDDDDARHKSSADDVQVSSSLSNSQSFKKSLKARGSSNDLNMLMISK